MSTLILTDHLSHDQAYAAAAALRVFPEADLRIIEWRQACDVLEGSAHDYDTVIILGVSLLHNHTRAAMALAQLREVGCKVHYFTDDREFFTPPPLNQLMGIHCDRHSLANAVLSQYALSADDLRQGQAECRSHRALVGEFIEASWERLHQGDGDASYRQVIEALSQDGNPENWSLSLKALHRHWLRHAPHPLVGTCAGMESLHRSIEELLPRWWQDGLSPSPLLLCGEPGTPLRDLAVMLQCPSLTSFPCGSALGESLSQALVQADAGAILLEDIEALPPASQTLLASFLDTGRVAVAGKSHAVEARLIATTHQNLPALVKAGQFLPSLWRRLQTCQLWLPPLRERLEDLPEIATELCRRRGFALPAGVLESLQGYDFPGNEDELGVLLERANLSPPESFRQHVRLLLDAPPSRAVSPGVDGNPPEDLESAIRLHVRTMVEKCGGNKSQAAQRLGITRTTLRKYL
ncbi:MAG: sigma-54-dependent Fis family transcriptional regulator [Victivallales bacterium]|nr:sigma-54-dependent Fis family transcriptional regulator [Victivallales bacterium]